MAKLNAAKRKAMPSTEFALPGKRFPMNDATHARAAISGASRAANVGNITPMQETMIKTKARGKLKKM